MARIGAYLFEGLVAYGAFEAMALDCEVASATERWRAWAADRTTPHRSRSRLHGRQLRYRRATWRHPNGR